MEGYDPISLSNYNLEEWLSEEDNVVFYFNNEIVCFKRSYFNEVSINDIVSKLVIVDGNILYKKSLNSAKYINMISYGIKVGLINLKTLKRVLSTNNVFRFRFKHNLFYGSNYNYLLNNFRCYEDGKLFTAFDEEKLLVFKHYTLYWDGPINALLREGEEKYRRNPIFLEKYLMYGETIDIAIENIKYHIKVIDLEFSNSLKIEQETVVFRGTRDSKIYDGINLGYISTTYDKEVSKQFANPLNVDRPSIFELHLHVGIPYIYLDQISKVGNESEILLPRGLNSVLRTNMGYNGEHNYYIVDVYPQTSNQFSNNENFSIYSEWELIDENDTSELIEDYVVNRYVGDLPIDDYTGELINPEDQILINNRYFCMNSLNQIAFKARDLSFEVNNIVIKDEKLVYHDPSEIRDPFTRLEFPSHILAMIEPTHFFNDLIDFSLVEIPKSITKAKIKHVNISYEFDGMKITNLELIRCIFSNDSIFRQFENLESLTAIKSYIKIKQFKLLGPNLKHIEVDYQKEFIDLSFLSNCVNLENIIIKSCDINSISGIDNFRNLKYLELYFNKITTLEDIVHCQSLEDLRVSEIKDISPIFQLSNLKFLELNACKIETLAGIENLHNLEQLEIQYMRTDIGLAFVDLTPLSSCINLTHLNLNNCSLRDISGLFGCVNLLTLHIHGNDSLYNIDVVSNFKKLKEIYMAGVPAGYSALKDLKFLTTVHDYAIPKKNQSMMSKEILFTY